MIVSAEPEGVWRVWLLRSSCPFSITRRDPGDAVVSVTSPASCKSPQTIPWFAVVGGSVSVIAVVLPDCPHTLRPDRPPPCLSSCGKELAVEPQGFAGMWLASEEYGSATAGTLLA